MVILWESYLQRYTLAKVPVPMVLSSSRSSTPLQAADVAPEGAALPGETLVAALPFMTSHQLTSATCKPCLSGESERENQTTFITNADFMAIYSSIMMPEYLS